MTRWARRFAPRNSAGTARQNARRRGAAAWCRCHTPWGRRTRRCTPPATPTPASRTAAIPGTAGTSSGGPRTAPVCSGESPQSWRARQRRVAPARDRARPRPRPHERHRAAGAEAGENVRAARLERPHLLREVRREILDAPERLAPAVEPGRLEPEEGLVVAQLLRQRAIAKHITVVPGHREHR